MKKLIAVFAFVFTLALTSASALAATHWHLSISKPTGTSSKEFKVAYNVLSTSDSDSFTVKLYQTGNATPLGQQTVTGQPTKPGNSGAFDVKVASAGTYSYYVTAANGGDGSTKTSETVAVTVTNQPTVTSNSGVTTASANSDNAAAFSSEGNLNDGSQNNGEEKGQVTGGSTDDKKDDANKEVLGSTGNNGGSENTGWYVAGGAALAVGGGLAAVARFRPEWLAAVRARF